MDFATAASQVEKASRAQDIFKTLKADAIKEVYKQFARVLHPDKNDQSARSARAFLLLGKLKREAEALAGGKTPRRKPAFTPTTIKTRKREYRLESLEFQGDLCDLYRCSFETGMNPVDALFKIVRDSRNNDLLERETKNLKAVSPKGKYGKFYRYLPKILDSFQLRAPKTPPRMVAVLPFFKEYRSMVEVKEVYPDGLDFRDVVWMFKRTLVALGFVHRQGYVHGAVLPSHILVDPIGHGAKLVDWCYSSKSGEGKIPALSREFKDFYAPEILKKEKPTPHTDIYMAARCAQYLLNNDAPGPIQGFFEGCLFGLPQRRPGDAWALHDEFDSLLYKLVGKPKYRRLVMPERKGE